METDGRSLGAQELLNTELKENEALHMGSLDNGLRYVILPNRSPPSTWVRSGLRQGRFWMPMR